MSMVKPEFIPSTSCCAKDLVGTWTLVSVVTEEDGRKSDAYGPNAKGLLVFDSNGRYSIAFIAANLPKFVSGRRSQGTTEENNAVVAGSLAHFGTYTVGERVYNTMREMIHRGWEHQREIDGKDGNMYRNQSNIRLNPNDVAA